MQILRIVLLWIIAAICYGIAHFTVTAQFSSEFFTVDHRRAINSDHPVVLAVIWGVLDYWLIGALLGIMVGMAARLPLGPARMIDARNIVRSLTVLLVATATVSAIAGIIGWFLARHDAMTLHEYWPTASQVPADRHDQFLASHLAWAASWVVLFSGGVWLTVATLLRRRSMAIHGSAWQDD